MTNYYPDVVDLVIKMMKDTFGSTFRAYYEGDPMNIPLTLMPCVVVEKLTTDYQNGATRQDNVISVVNIKIIYNKKDDYHADPTVDMTERKLKRICEGRYPESGLYMEATISGLFRKNMTLGDNVIDNELLISYDVIDRENNSRTSEALITMRTRETVSVPDRM